MHLCVQMHPKHSKCKPVGLTTMFENLQSSSHYNFSVFSYYNVSENDLMVLSGKNCSLGNYYTCKYSVLFISFFNLNAF